MPPRPPVDDEALICAECAGGDPFLAEQFEMDGEDGACSVCDREKIVVPLWALSDIVHELFKKYARSAEESFEIDGDRAYPVDGGTSPMEMLEVELGFPYKIAESLLDVLATRHSRDQNHDPGFDWYDATCEAFELRPEESNSASYAWDVFVEQVRHHGRFFNDAARAYLDELFGPLLKGELHQPPTVRLGAPDSKYQEIFRGRVANKSADQAKIYKNPRRELSPPPKWLRRANRMNAEGVSPFYGALDIETCVAELRPMVHGCVVVGTFKFVRPVTVLDLRLVDNAVPKLSWFDPDFSEKHAAGAFIRDLHDIMRVPVFPEADALEYLPTHVIAEYLASKGVDGVLYVSSLIDREKPDEEGGLIRLRDVDDEGVNLVLFSHSSLVMGVRDDIEWNVVDVGSLPENGLMDTQYVERTPSELDNAVDDYPLVDDALAPTLKFVEDSVAICVVKGIKHELITGKVRFNVSGEKSTDDFPF